MTARSPGAFLLSAAFHALIVVLLFLLGVVAQRSAPASQRVLELVAGEGDNFMATEAPALGSPTGVKLDIPVLPVATPDPTPAPVEPPPAPAEPIAPEPIPVPLPKAASEPVTKAEAPKRSMANETLRKYLNAQNKAKREIAKQRAEEQKEQKRLSKAEFDRLQKQKGGKATPTTKGAGTPKVARIDGAGIAKGVAGGSTANTTGGAGGKALAATSGAATERYFALLVQRVTAAIDKPPGISDGLEVKIGFRISAWGTISNVRILESSGSDAWDEAVMAAFRRVSMPAHPERKSEDAEVIFGTTEVPSR